MGSPRAVVVSEQALPRQNRIAPGLRRRRALRPSLEVIVRRRVVEEYGSREPQQLRVADRTRNDGVEHRLVDRREEAGDVELERPRGAATIGGDSPHERHQPIARRQHALPLPAGVRIVDEPRLEDRLEARDQHMVHDPVAEVGGEHLPRLRSISHEANGPPRQVGVCPQLRCNASSLASASISKRSWLTVLRLLRRQARYCRQRFSKVYRSGVIARVPVESELALHGRERIGS